MRISRFMNNGRILEVGKLRILFANINSVYRIAIAIDSNPAHKANRVWDWEIPKSV